MNLPLRLPLLLALLLVPFTPVWTAAEPVDPSTYLLNEEDLPRGFSQIPDSDKTDSRDGATMKFRAYARGDAIINGGAYSAPTEEVAVSLYNEIRDNYVSIGSVWDEVPELGDEALSTSAFQLFGSIQRVVVFRSGSVTGVIQYNDREAFVKADDAVRLARLMHRNGTGAQASQ